MPYIQDRRKRLKEGTALPQNAGELNFMVCVLADGYLARKGLSYAVVNEVIGAIECAKQEIYRRVVAPYEDAKCAENGDVFTTVPGQWTGGLEASP